MQKVQLVSPFNELQHVSELQCCLAYPLLHRISEGIAHVKLLASRPISSLLTILRRCRVNSKAFEMADPDAVLSNMHQTFAVFDKQISFIRQRFEKIL